MRAKSTSAKSPPRARLAFRVGIVGHRPDRLPKEQATLDALRQTLRHALEVVQLEVSLFASAEKTKPEPLYSRDAPILRAISPLAEGTDRMFADEAIDLGYELLCPMPFHQEEFEKDFLPPDALEEHSRDRFRDLLRRAQEAAGLTTFELDGQRSAAGDAYAMAGRVVLNQSDLLIAVWDRGKPAGGGGTVQTIREGVHYHVPVLWIDALKPRTWKLLRTDDDISCIESGNPCGPSDSETELKEANQSITAKIKDIVAAELAPPKPRVEENQVTKLNAADYFAEPKPQRNLWFVWKIFRDLIGSGQLKLPKLLVPDFEGEISNEWPIRDDIEGSSSPASSDTSSKGASYAPSAMEDWVNRHLRSHYAWADKLADFYADHYRSGYISIYLLSAFAVFTALVLPRAAFGAICEFFFVGAIVWLFRQGSSRHWHERWIEYRLLAELIRQIRILIPLGGGRPLPRTPTHLSIYENLTQTWMHWHMRAIARTTGIPQAKVRPEYMLDCLRYMAKLVGGQLAFHKVTQERSKSMSILLHTIARDLFLVSLCFIPIRFFTLVMEHFSVSHGVLDGFTLMLAALPALGAAFIWLSSGSGMILFVLAAFAALGAALYWRLSGSVDDLFLALAAMPAFGAALTGIANQGEFARLEKRSIAMASAFEQFVARIAELQSKIMSEPTAVELSKIIVLATEITQVMVDEVSDWRVVVAEQPMRMS